MGKIFACQLCCNVDSMNLKSRDRAHYKLTVCTINYYDCPGGSYIPTSCKIKIQVEILIICKLKLITVAKISASSKPIQRTKSLVCCLPKYMTGTFKLSGPATASSS